MEETVFPNSVYAFSPAARIFDELLVEGDLMGFPMSSKVLSMRSICSREKYSTRSLKSSPWDPHRYGWVRSEPKVSVVGQVGLMTSSACT